MSKRAHLGILGSIILFGNIILWVKSWSNPVEDSPWMLLVRATVVLIGAGIVLWAIFSRQERLEREDFLYSQKRGRLQ